MKHFLIILFAAAGVTGCATTSDPVGGLASSAFDYSPTRSSETPDSHFGYSLNGDGWASELIYESERGGINVAFSFEGSGREQSASLSLEEPYLNDGVRRFTGETSRGEEVFVILQAGPCNDGGANYFATLVMAGERFDGCAIEDSAQDRWSNYLVEWLPSIDLCVDEMQGQADQVTYVAATTSGTSVRMGDGNGNRWDCITVNDQRVNAIIPVGSNDTIFGESDPIFIRSQQPAMGDGCYAYETVREADGELIGVFGYDSCAGPGRPVG